MGQRLTDSLLKRICRWRVRIWKDAPQRISSRKHKLKRQWNTVFTYHNGWNPKHWEHISWLECREIGILISLLLAMQNDGHYGRPKWTKPIWKCYIICDSHYMMYCKAKTKEEVERSVVSKYWGRGEGKDE